MYCVPESSKQRRLMCVYREVVQIMASCTTMHVCMMLQPDPQRTRESWRLATIVKPIAGATLIRHLRPGEHVPDWHTGAHSSARVCLSAFEQTEMKARDDQSRCSLFDVASPAVICNNSASCGRRRGLMAARAQTTSVGELHIY